MRTWVITAFIVFMVSGLIGCNNRKIPTSGLPSIPDENEITLTPPAVDETRVRLAREMIASPFLDIKNKCKNENAYFNVVNQTCECTSGKVFNGWLEKNNCQEPTKTSKCFKDENSFSKTLESSGELEFKRCLNISTYEWDKSNRLKLGLKFLESLSSLNEQAAWADRNASYILQNSLQAATFSKNGNIIILIGTGVLDTDMTDNILNQSESIPINGYVSDGNMSDYHYFHIREDQDLSRIFASNSTGTLENMEDISEVEVSEQQEVESLKTAYNRISTIPFKENTTISYSDHGCAGSCELRMEFKFSDLKQHATRVRQYTGGSLFKDWVIIRNDQSKIKYPQALVTLTPAGNINMIFLFRTETSISTLSPSFTGSVSYKVYDSKFKPLSGGWIPQALSSDLYQLSGLKDNMKIASQDIKNPTLVVCESGFAPEATNTIGAKYFLLGPDTKSSFYGWSNSNYFNGVTRKNTYDLPFSDGYYVNHASQVGKIAIGLNTRNAFIIPIGLDECLLETHQWAENVKSHTVAKVVSLSGAQLYEREACRQSMIAKNISETELDFLWVVGAGNDSTNYDMYPSSFCPGTLNDYSNVILVASGSEEGIDSFSSYGRFSVAMVAEGDSIAGPKRKATSFSAPRVAHLAAEIAALYPQFSIQRIKKSILFGTTHSSALMNVMSGGFLNEMQSLNFAKLWSKNPDLSDIEILLKFYSLPAAQKRIKLYRERRLIGD